MISAGNDIARRSPAAGGLASWLGLAACPTFAAMAFLTCAFGDADTMCSATHGGAHLSGMATMYLLMSTFIQRRG